MLPDAVLQGMGWSPPPSVASLPGIPGQDGQQGAPGQPPGVGLPPEVLQSLGLGPPSGGPPSGADQQGGGDFLAPPAPPPAQVGTLPPSIAALAHPPAQAAPPPDVVVPAPGAPHGPGPGATAPPPQRQAAPPALSPDRAMAQNEARLVGANQAEQGAVAAQAQAQLGAAADVLAAERVNVARTEELQKQAAAQREEATQAHLLAQRTVMDRMKALDDYKIDQNQYWNSMGVGDHIGWYIGIALSQIGNALMGRGGENPVMQMLQDKMKQSIVMQQDKRDQLDKSVGRAKDLMQEGDLYQARRAADIAAAEADATKMLKLKVDLATAKAADPTIRANGVAESAKLERQLSIDLTNAIDKRADYTFKQRQNDISERNSNIAGGHLALERDKFKLDTVKESWKENREQQALNLQAAKEALLERKAIGEKDAQLGVTAPVNDGKGGMVDGMLRNKDGTVWHAGNPEIATKTQNMVAAAMTYNRIARQVIAGIAEHGGESSWLKSDDFQRMKTDMEAAVVELHDAYGITSFREPTVKFFESMSTANVDPTSFVYNATAAFQQSASDLQKRVNTKMHAANYDGPPISFAPLAPSEAVSQKQKDLTALKDNRGFGPIGDQVANMAENYGDKAEANRWRGLDSKLAIVASLAKRAESRGIEAVQSLNAIVGDEGIAEPVRDAARQALAAADEKRKAGSYENADKSYDNKTPDPVTGKISDIVRRINTPPALHPTIQPGT